MNRHREYYRRHLPHWQPAGAVFFVTFRLKGSLPYEVIEELLEEREQVKKGIRESSEDHREERNYLNQHVAFRKWDRLLDKGGTGARWLARPEIAEIVRVALHYRDEEEYTLYAYCIMSNHVHAVFEPLSKSDCQSDSPNGRPLPLNKIMQSLKRHTARQSNKVLGREGSFWQDESYDHVIRDNREFEWIIEYVLHNPVEAGLVQNWEDWPWTYKKQSD